MKYSVGVVPIGPNDEPLGEMSVQDVELLADVNYYLPRIIEAIIVALRKEAP